MTPGHTLHVVMNSYTSRVLILCFIVIVICAFASIDEV